MLKRDDQAGFNNLLRDVYDPHSKFFRDYLTQQQIADRFGPSRAAYGSILAYLEANGFALVRGSANRLAITVRGTRAQAEHAFDIRIGDYRMGRRSFFANDSDPALPPEFILALPSHGDDSF